MPKAEADVIVVGAGPGGSAAAANLARRGVGGFDYFVSLCILAVFLRQRHRSYYSFIFCLCVYLNCLGSTNSLCNFNVWLDE